MTVKLQLTRRKQVTVLTWQGRLLAALIVLLLGIAVTTQIYDFLAPNKPLRGQVLVVDGSLPDFAMKVAKEQFNEFDYECLVVTGGPFIKGQYLMEFKDLAHYGKANFEALGVPPALIFAVPNQSVKRDRTYASAKALKQWLDKSNPQWNSVDLFSVGAHGRRNRLLFSKALGADFEVGVISIKPDQEPWWQTSSGVRSVIGESIAYLYSVLIFNPEKNQ